MLALRYLDAPAPTGGDNLMQLSTALRRVEDGMTALEGHRRNTAILAGGIVIVGIATMIFGSLWIGLGVVVLGGLVVLVDMARRKRD